jgi:hypothetical protein
MPVILVLVRDARHLLKRLAGEPLRTITHGKPNTILRVEGDTVVVATDRSPLGKPVSIQWVQDALNALDRDGEIRLDKTCAWYSRAAFIGAVLSTLPDAEVVQTRPRTIRRGR